MKLKIVTIIILLLACSCGCGKTINKEDVPVTHVEQAEITPIYIGNKNTKKFHRPDCPSVSQMEEKNRVKLNCTRDEAVDEGYVACARCLP